ncbi:MAG: GTP-binding signal recognition particle [Ignavibacteria bacterium]|nr:MAG: GTP-binding signal recognition particle [Ignavibacteria bacterium]KAF0157619.1 MAG: GTP-binding signal recognition particle [Ignavibacteria bacterium]
MNDQLIYKDEAFRIIGCCMEVHKELGKGFSEIVYKDALEIEFQINGIDYKREKEYDIAYKGHILPRKYFADFIVMNKIILEAKAIETLTNSHIKQILNYLAASKLHLGLLINFGEESLKYKRVVL